MAGLVAIAVAVILAQAQTTTTAAPRLSKNQADVELVVRVNGGGGGNSNLVVSNIGSSGQDGVRFSVDSFFDIHVSNIGSSGEDGVSYSIDSFFDIFYEVSFRAPGGHSSASVPIELVALQLRGSNVDTDNPEHVLSDLKDALGDAGTVITGHVTLCCPR